MTIEKGFFRQVMGQFVTGVTVVTTKGSEGIAGLTVNAFCSVSIEPPMVLICVDLRSHVLPAIRENRTFVVNILTDEQEQLSRCFATPSAERYDNFCSASYTTAVTGSPVLDGALAFVDTRMVAEYPGGDHAIFLGQVMAMGTDGEVVFANEGDRENSELLQLETASEFPLAYYRAKYRHLTPDYQKPSLKAPHDETAE